MAEFNRWCPALRAIRFHGTREEREDMVNRYFTNAAAAHDGRRPSKKKHGGEDGELIDDNSENPREWDVCVTTYEVCNTEKKSLQKFAWKYLVIDEAHRLKNEASLFSTTVRTFNTAHRLLLTGLFYRITPRLVLNILSMRHLNFSFLFCTFPQFRNGKTINTKDFVVYFHVLNFCTPYLLLLLRSDSHSLFKIIYMSCGHYLTSCCQTFSQVSAFRL
jgi:hypothetical protein